jgi:hypothetical protein
MCHYPGLKKESRPENEPAPINPITMKTQRYVEGLCQQNFFSYRDVNIDLCQ